MKNFPLRIPNFGLWLLFILWLVIVCLWLTARSNGVAGRPLTVLWGYDPELFDPQQSADPIALSIFGQVCEPLFYLNLDGQPRGLLAEDEFTFSENGKQLLVQIRSGITFHDGATLDAAAVQASFQRLLRLGSSPLLGGLTGVEFVVQDAKTLVFQLPTANYDFVRLVLSNPFAGIVSPRNSATEKPGFVACTGAYHYAKELYQPGVSLSLVRFTKYNWAAIDFANRGAAQIAQIDFRFQPDPLQRLDELRNGTGCLLSLDPEQVASVASDERFQFYKATGGVTYLGFNFLQPHLQDLRVRQAIAHAINKAVLISNPAFEIANTPFSPTVVGYDAHAATFAYGYDPAVSRQLLQSANFDFSQEFVLLHPDDPTYQQLAEQVVQQLAAIGITKVQLHAVPRAEISSLRQSFDLLLFDYAWGNYTALAIFLGPNARNLLSYPNYQVAALVQQALAASTLEERQNYLLEAQRVVLQDAVWQPLVIRHLTIAVKKSCVEGERQGFFGEIVTHDAWTH